MQFSLFFFAADAAAPDTETPRTGTRGDGYALLLDAARFADSHDFTAVWTPERHFNRFGGLYPNPSVTSAAVAAVTDRIAVRAGSVVAPLHDPLRIAEEWAVVDNLSGGRAGISFGSGWHPTDFTFAPQNFADRAAITEQTIRQVRTLWSGKPLTRTTATGESTEIELYPRPISTDLPVWLTSAGSEATFRAAGEMGAGILTHMVTTGRPILERNIAAYRNAFRPCGDAMPEPHVTLMLHTFVGGDGSAAAAARAALRTYVMSSMDLFRSRGGNTPDSPAHTPEQIDKLVDISVRRFLTSAGLFGEPEDGVELVRSLSQSGVCELACLVDFGMPSQMVLDGLADLDRLRQMCAAT
ncbi:MupA/Atu3671 family FMN-dependent luciferase-like monooxygenase [Williamsia sp. CHRR-6]|uniref:MupA/Atu3671 family FMN-dependent luciferase-like monooxygenase n=1 Tax=Williamsia sp. CHRR-6 TaxID=2835871 RepID=UPI001BD9341E|nr:MupA/Atu3671 family FMN-dependent luciferase-like monooxygenase [Williamsia sp. CHRR-6]MBT0566977.1 LLM class flavin-dependent oxidoreductase [Williamsia sp. CHRR-6]